MYNIVKNRVLLGFLVCTIFTSSIVGQAASPGSLVKHD